ncbi:hypothetical protein evm_009680 [Chilo suppressalis]|nr:hypothetical protein evm_009680 [Chilo suppressalis]
MAIISEEDETLMDTSITGPLTIMDLSINYCNLLCRSWVLTRLVKEDKDMAMVTEEPAHENVGAVSAGPSTLMNATKLTSSLSLPDSQIGDVPVSDLDSIFDTPRKMKLRALYRLSGPLDEHSNDVLFFFDMPEALSLHLTPFTPWFCVTPSEWPPVFAYVWDFFEFAPSQLLSLLES